MITETGEIGSRRKKTGGSQYDGRDGKTGK